MKVKHDQLAGPSRRVVVLAACALFGATVLLYLPTFSFEFVTLDDYQYVVDNDLVRDASLSGAFRFFAEVFHPSTVDGYYQPLTMVSLMFDAGLAGEGGRDPLPYHATSVLLHAMNTVLVFVLLRQIFGGLWVPLVMAAVFAAHPVQVESVSWISQRKTVLATLFALASLAAYLRSARGGRLWLVASVGLFVLGTLAKPTILLLPFALILFDVWPLRRPLRRAMLEKTPFIVIMLCMGWIAWRSQAASAAALAAPTIGGWQGLASWVALLSYNFSLYLGNVLWPTALSPYRALPDSLSLGDAVIAASVIVSSVFALVTIVSIRRSRSLFVGAVAFVVLLLPTLGGIRFSATCVADRFLYLPMVFAILPVAALGRHILTRWPRQARALGGIAAALLIGLSTLSWSQQHVWRDSRSLWSHVHEIVPGLAKASYQLAVACHDEGDFAECRSHAEQALAAEPSNAHTLHMLGRALARTGEAEQAIEAIRQAIAADLGDKEPLGYVSLAEAHVVAGDAQAAEQALRRAVELGRDEARTWSKLGDAALGIRRDNLLAAEYFRRAVILAPENLDDRYKLATALKRAGRTREALAEYEAFVTRARAEGRDLRIVQAVEVAMQHLRRSLDDDGTGD